MQLAKRQKAQPPEKANSKNFKFHPSTLPHYGGVGGGLFRHIE